MRFAETAGLAFLEQPLYISPSVNHPDDAKRFCVLVDDKVRMDRPEANILGYEIVALVAQIRHIGEMAKRPVEIFKHPVGRDETILGYEFPDLTKIAKTRAGKLEPLQARCWRRSAL